MKILGFLERIAAALERSAPPRDVMTVEQVADYLAVSENTIYNLMGKYEFPVHRLTDGGCLRFQRAEVEKWFLSRRVENVVDHRRLIGGRP